MWLGLAAWLVVLLASSFVVGSGLWVAGEPARLVPGWFFTFMLCVFDWADCLLGCVLLCQRIIKKWSGVEIVLKSTHNNQ